MTRDVSSSSKKTCRNIFNGMTEERFFMVMLPFISLFFFSYLSKCHEHKNAFVPPRLPQINYVAAGCWPSRCRQYKVITSARKEEEVGTNLHFANVIKSYNKLEIPK
mmetsp:Transcript_30243/g.44166  ORF Transcript_30243/g.44166 Transcript_30243/m.44166 type:complete len:107 (+) Transcript_30243:355-675(+)